MSTHWSGRSALGKIATDPVSRRRFLAVGGATGGAGALLAACGGNGGDTTSTASTTAANDALAQFGKGDLGIVNYALTLEYLEAAFYADVVGSGLFKGADLALIRGIRSNEDAHVAALEGTAKKLGGTPAPKPKTHFPINDANQVLMLAATVENLGAAAYLGQAAAIQDPEVLAAALAIHTVEGRHASALNTMTGQPFTPDGAFAVPAEANEVLDQVKPFIVS
jgi:hypothetical protein